MFEVVNGADEIQDFLNGVPHDNKGPDFSWVPFYEELIGKVLPYRDDRDALLDLIPVLAKASKKPRLFDFLKPKKSQFGTDNRLSDIDPFTMYAPFNRGTTTENRLSIASAYKEVFQLAADVPTGFDGIPLLNSLSSWFMYHSKETQEFNVEPLWDLAVAGVSYAENPTELAKENLVSAFDASKVNQTPRLTMGLFYIRPKTFTAFDSRNVSYLRHVFPDVDQRLTLSSTLSGEQFLENTEAIQEWLHADLASPESIPDLSHNAYFFSPETLVDEAEVTEQLTIDDSYDVSQIVADGCFIDEERLESMLNSLKAKKNLILQGPPGTGKTWLARRLGWALIGKRDADRLTVMQFHPSMSYEDFVRGWRPSGDGSLKLSDGPFLEICEQARADADTPYVLVLEEINRGNPAQIFGEMLTLIEHNKRTEKASMRLVYPDGDERFYVPPNLHIIGTMNLADRSLALVDMAFRRRFAFVNLVPEIGDNWLEYTSQQGYDRESLEKFSRRITAVNQSITDDPALGAQFCIGHSFFVPHAKASEPESIEETSYWLRNVVDKEIQPLLDEYWFDQPDKVKTATDLLKDGL